MNMSPLYSAHRWQFVKQMTTISWSEPCLATEVHITARVWSPLTVLTLKQEVCRCCVPLVALEEQPHEADENHITKPFTIEWRKHLFAVQNMVKRNTPAGHLIVVQMRFSIREMGSRSLKPFVISLFALSGFFLRWSYLLNCKGSGHAAET